MPKRPTKTYERPGLSEEEIEEIREAFNLFSMPVRLPSAL